MKIINFLCLLMLTLNVNSQTLKPFNEFIISILEETAHDINELEVLTNDYCNQDKEILKLRSDFIKSNLNFTKGLFELTRNIAQDRDKQILDFVYPYFENKYNEAVNYCTLYGNMVDEITCPDPLNRLFGRLYFISRDTDYLISGHIQINSILK